jgi:hypothetical protein
VGKLLGSARQRGADSADAVLLFTQVGSHLTIVVQRGK